MKLCIDHYAAGNMKRCVVGTLLRYGAGTL